MTITRRFQAGDTFELWPVHYRIVQGCKGPDDLRLEWRAAGEWRPVTMAHSALHADFFCENEEILYPTCRGQRGAHYFLGWLGTATKVGWDEAVRRLNEDKRKKRAS